MAKRTCKRIAEQSPKNAISIKLARRVCKILGPLNYGHHMYGPREVVRYFLDQFSIRSNPNFRYARMGQDVKRDVRIASRCPGSRLPLPAPPGCPRHCRRSVRRPSGPTTSRQLLQRLEPRLLYELRPAVLLLDQPVPELRRAHQQRRLTNVAAAKTRALPVLRRK